jgi:hypothetical protein
MHRKASKDLRRKCTKRWVPAGPGSLHGICWYAADSSHPPSNSKSIKWRLGRDLELLGGGGGFSHRFLQNWRTTSVRSVVRGGSLNGMRCRQSHHPHMLIESGGGGECLEKWVWGKSGVCVPKPKRCNVKNASAVIDELWYASETPSSPR